MSGHFLGLFFDLNPLSLGMLIFVLLLGGMILNYARRYMASDLDQKKFLLRFCLLISMVILLILSNNLLTAFIAWQGIGFFIYQLLTHYPDRPQAIKAAKLKCLITRLGDLCFISAIFIAYFTLGNSNYSALLNSHYSLEIGFLLAIAVMTKSSLFPFHQWLPETLETPTPVSAVMHAGVINAGGFLLLRNWALFSAHPALLIFLSFIGLVTAFWGLIYKIKASSVKKKLAYSTQSQMGFMTFQYGIGAPAAAFFHIFAHGVFKATAFLNSADLASVNKINSARNHIKNTKLHKLIPISTSIFLAVGGGFLIKKLFGVSVSNPILLSFIEITMAQLIYQTLRSHCVVLIKIFCLCFIFILFALYNSIIFYWSHYFSLIFNSRITLPVWLTLFFILVLWSAEIIFWLFFEAEE